MRGILLAGGKGTRLLPATKIINKHLIPILNTPMIMFPLDTLKSFGITDIAIVTGGGHVGGFAEFLGDGSRFGVKLTYFVQEEAGGIAQALGLTKDFAAGYPVAVILSDNIFDNSKIPDWKKNDYDTNAQFFTSKEVKDMTRFGVIRLLNDKHIVIEKPETILKDDSVVTGLYIYPNEVFGLIPGLTPSARGELEITEINNIFIKTDSYDLNEISGFWSDSGTVDSIKEVIDWAYKNSQKTD